MHHVEISQSMQSAVAGLSGPMRQVSLEPASDTLALPEKAFNNCKPHTNGQDQIHLRTFHTFRECRASCPCVCHDTWYAHIPWKFSSIIGRGSALAKGPSLNGESCSWISCKRSRLQYVRICYTVPTWVAARMLYICFTSSPSHSPEFLMRLPHCVDNDNSGLQAVLHGDLDKLKLAVSSGECRPTDYNELGTSLIQVCMACEAVLWAHSSHALI